MVAKHAEPTVEEIARKAYEISESHESRSDEENWYRAEQALLTERPATKAAPKRLRAAAKAETATEKAPRAGKSKPADEKPAGKKK